MKVNEARRAGGRGDGRRCGWGRGVGDCVFRNHGKDCGFYSEWNIHY